MMLVIMLFKSASAPAVQAADPGACLELLFQNSRSAI